MGSETIVVWDVGPAGVCTAATEQQLLDSGGRKFILSKKEEGLL